MKVDLKKRALHRSKILQGQMKGLEKMIDDEKYCMDILTQSLAVQRSLGSLTKLILENHLRTHIDEKFSAADKSKHEEAIAELLEIYDLSKVRSK